MKNRNFHRILLIFALILVVVSIIAVVAAVNIVPGTLGTDYSTALTVNLIKPSQCSAITLTNLVVCAGGGTCSGTSAADLILGSASAETINGSTGNDCILGGAGNDTLNGGSGTDVCIGGAGTDTFSSCETQIQ